MPWTELAIYWRGKLHDLGFTEADEIFNVQMVPRTLSDRAFCLTSAGFRQNEDAATGRGMPSELDPVNQLRISVIFELGNNSTELYDKAITDMETIAGAVLDPDNRSSSTRIVTGYKVFTRLLRESGFWLICDATFDVVVEL
jgi:hypothetical protein